MNTFFSAPRRSFIQLAGGLSAASAAAPWLSAMGASASSPSSASLVSTADPAGFAYVGTYTRDAPGGTAGGPASTGIHVFAMRAQGWRLVQVMESDNPSYLAVHPTRRFLYAINEIEHWQGLPRGTAEAYAIDAADGSLRLLNRQPLSLSSTAPAHLAVSPDGKHLVTAQYLGGTYNVLPINRDGSLGAVSGIVKETGSGPRPEQQSAHPHMVLFDPIGQRVLATDLGSDRINTFTLADGNLSLSARTELPPAVGHVIWRCIPTARCCMSSMSLMPTWRVTGMTPSPAVCLSRATPSRPRPPALPARATRRHCSSIRPVAFCMSRPAASRTITRRRTASACLA